MNISPRAKDILLVLGVTGFVAVAILVPGLPKVLTPFLKKQYKKWGHFNRRLLKAELKRMQKGGLVEQSEEKGQISYKLTEKGKTKFLIHRLEDIRLDKKWDGKWRIVAYDIPKSKKNQADSFRLLLKKMEFLKLQKSVYLTPYQCHKEVEFLKNLYHFQEEVTLLTLNGLEGEIAYKKYFGL